MLKLDAHPTGRHFLNIPGPSPVPDRILRAMSLPTIDHRGPEFGALGPGDSVLMYEGGQFATLWQKIAVKLGLQPEFLSLPGTDEATGLPLGWRHGVQAALIEERLRADPGHAIRAACVVHNEPPPV